MNILVTGGCGFIGSHLVEYYIDNGHNVTVIDNLSAGRIENLVTIVKHPNLRIIKSDLRFYEKLQQIVNWSDCVMHFAAMLGMYKVMSNPIQVLKNNIQGAERLLDAIVNSKKNIRLFVASTSMVYGDLLGDDSTEIDPLSIKSIYDESSAYTASKIVDEMYAINIYKKYNISATILRLFNVIGARQSGQYGMVVPRFVEQACLGEDITVYGDGKQTRSFCDVKNVVASIEALRDCDASIGQVVNIGSKTEISINELALLIKKLANSNSVIKHIPYAEVYGNYFVDIMRRKPCLKKLESLVEISEVWTLDRSIASLIFAFKASRG